MIEPWTAIGEGTPGAGVEVEKNTVVEIREEGVYPQGETIGGVMIEIKKGGIGTTTEGEKIGGVAGAGAHLVDDTGDSHAESNEFVLHN